MNFERIVARTADAHKIRSQIQFPGAMLLYSQACGVGIDALSGMLMSAQAPAYGYAARSVGS